MLFHVRDHPVCDGQHHHFDGRLVEPATSFRDIATTKKMKFEPGQKDGKPTDWPGLNTPMNLTKPNG